MNFRTDFLVTVGQMVVGFIAIMCLASVIALGFTVFMHLLAWLGA